MFEPEANEILNERHFDAQIWASEGFFQGGGNNGFFQLEPKHFFQGGNEGEILFYQLEAKKKAFFSEKVDRKISI